MENNGSVFVVVVVVLRKKLVYDNHITYSDSNIMKTFLGRHDSIKFITLTEIFYGTCLRKYNIKCISCAVCHFSLHRQKVLCG